MAKNRKTKKEKLRSSERISPATKLPLPETLPLSDERGVFTFATSGATALHKKNESAMTNRHLREDLLRTGTVIGAIILAELILYYTLVIR